MQVPSQDVDAMLRSAIRQRHLIRLVYQNRERILEPHDYGIHKGVVKLLGYQLAGSSSGPLPNWRWMEVDEISDVEQLKSTFPGGRGAPSGKHQKWDQIFVRVAPAKKKK